MDISIMIDELINYYLIIAHKDISESLKDKSEEEIKALYYDTFGED
ncbi:MAG: hypothetical protein SPD90_06870 [Intestinibacter sp.]|nr:hypothetical protein [Intestinibacter sp.]MDY4574764.1 hypothetical protein [Intestinibacter sp.]